MINFSNMKKMIYFPDKYHRKNMPYVIYVIEKWGNDWKGNQNADELLKGRFSFYKIVRCQPYSDELWKACEDLITRKAKLDEDFNGLMEKGIGKP